MARETGLEPAASAVTGRRSNQLSYSRIPISYGRLKAPAVTEGQIREPARPVKLPFGRVPERAPHPHCIRRTSRDRAYNVQFICQFSLCDTSIAKEPAGAPFGVSTSAQV